MARPGGGHEWAYLATVIDCYSKACIGWALAGHMRTDLICDALDMAARNYDLAPGCIFHSDRGTQGGFNWLSQHLDPEVGRDVEAQGPGGGQAGGSAAAVGGGSGVAGADAFAWAA